MTVLRIAALCAALSLAMPGLSGCASQQAPAEQALAGIEKTLEGSGEQVQKFLPEKYEAIVAKVEGLRANLAAGEYRKVVNGAPAVVDELRRAVADAAVRRAQVRLEIEAEWDELVKSVPAMIAATDKRIAGLAGRPPQGMDKAGFKEVVARYETARNGWGEVATTISTANFDATVATARGLKVSLAEIMAALGVQAS